MQATTKNIKWRSLAWEGEEQLALTIGEAGIEARSELKGTDKDGKPYELRYIMELTPDWQVQHVYIADARNEGGMLDLIFESGQWFAGADRLDEFEGAPFIDLSLTPFTNTLPIKRLDFKGTEPQKADVLFIDLPSFEWRRTEQYYSKIGENTYHYQDVENPDFKADIVVDGNGMVLVYPGLFILDVK
jgi:uncharacterized protein